MDSIRQMKFYSLLLLDIGSIFCSFFLLYQFFFVRQIRENLHYRVLISLILTSLLTCLIDIPLILYYLWNDQSPMQNVLQCLFWNLIDLSLYGLISLLMLWTSIERYLFIFHRQLTLQICFRRYLSYLIPHVVIPSYVLIFYSSVIFLHPCKNNFMYNSVVCGELCYYSATPILALIDQLLNNIIPSIFISVINLFLLFRVFWQKRHRMRQSISWQRRRRMVLQLIPVVILYLSGVIPYGIAVLLYLLKIPTETSLFLQGHFFYLFYYIAVFIPFVCLIGIPTIYSRLVLKKTIVIHPAII